MRLQQLVKLIGVDTLAGPGRSALRAGLAMGMAAMAVSASAAFLHWNGSVDSDMTNPANWEWDQSGDTNPPWETPAEAPQFGDNAIVGREPSFTNCQTFTNSPVLSADYPADQFSVRALILECPDNSLTITGEGRILVRNDATALRDGNTLHVDTRTSLGLPAYIQQDGLHLGENGNPSSTPATLRIDGQGYVRMEIEGANQVLIGGPTDGSAGGPALIEIRDNGILEFTGTVGAGGITWATETDPSHNRIVMSDSAQLIATGVDAATINGWITAGLLTTDQAGVNLTVSGTDPITVTVSGPLPNAALGWFRFE